MINLTETSNFDANISVPQDGVDDDTAASLLASLGSLTNRTRKFFDFLGGLAGAITLPGLLTAAGFNCSGSANVGTDVNATGNLTAGGVIFAAPPTTVGAASGGGTFLLNHLTFFNAGMSAQSYALPTGVTLGWCDVALQAGATNTLTVTGAAVGSISMRYSSSGDRYSARFVYVGGAWNLVGGDHLP